MTRNSNCSKIENVSMKNYLQNIYKHLFCVALFAAFISAFSTVGYSQKVVDKTVATVSDGVRTELITYSDLMWQLALNPNVPISPPSSDDLNRSLQLIIRLRLIALEAERLPAAPPTKDKVDEEIRRILALFPSTAEFVKRLNTVGFDSITDDNFESLMRQRVAIEKYIDFRFRSFVVITPEDEEKYYRTEFMSEYRKKNPGALIPKIEDVRTSIVETLTEQRVEAEIEKFLDSAESNSEVVILSEV